MTRLLWALALVVTFTIGWAVAGTLRPAPWVASDPERLRETVARLSQQVTTLQARLKAREERLAERPSSGELAGDVAISGGRARRSAGERVLAAESSESRASLGGAEASAASTTAAKSATPATLQGALERFYKYLEAAGTGEGRGRWQQARALIDDLKAMGEVGAQALMHVLASGSDSDERRAAARLLGALQAPESLAALKNVIEHDDDVLLRRAAASSLRQLQTPDSVPVMERMLANPSEDRFVRLSAAYGLAEAGQPQGVAGLAQIFAESTGDGRGRDMAFRALASLDDDRSLPFMRQLAGSDLEPGYRLRAIRYLAAQGDTASLGTLQMLMRSATEQPSIRDAAAQAYRLLGGR
ncbi:MAG TPA: HEAT repeat domain-containing protein [Methylomirabilota bacterium]|jgi:HEAT repeats|nr:HEAT repeat domain-containing protein [Methylomirabilota bacterium]